MSTPALPAGIGDNRPPADLEVLAERIKDHLAGLDDRNREILDELADLQLDKMMLPATVESDEHVGEITAFAVKARKLRKRLEAVRDAEGRPFFEAHRTVTSTFNATRITPLEESVKAIEQRNAPYLRAKAERAEAERRELARQQAESARIARETADRERAEAARAQQEAEAAAARVRAAGDELARARAAEELREASERGRLSREAAEQAEADTAKASRAAETSERIADRGGHGRTSAGGGSANIVEDRVLTIDFPTVRQSLGMLGSYFTDDEIRRACEKADKLGRPVPGVTVTIEHRAKTTAARS